MPKWSSPEWDYSCWQKTTTKKQKQHKTTEDALIIVEHAFLSDAGRHWLAAAAAWTTGHQLKWRCTKP